MINPTKLLREARLVEAKPVFHITELHADQLLGIKAAMVYLL